MEKKVLFVTYKKPPKIMEGGGQGAKKNYDMVCAEVGQDNVTCYYVHDEEKKKSLWQYLLGAFFMLFNYYFGLTPGRVKRIVRLAADFDVVFIDRTLFGILAKKLKQSGYKGKIVSYFHNVERIYFDAKVSSKIPLRGVLIHCADVNDRYSCEFSDVIVALNERDRGLIAEIYGRTADFLVPVALPDRLSVEPSDEMTGTQPLCLFLGAYFGPNNEGILWFVKNVLPKVNIRMKIVGKGMAKLKEENECLSDIEVYSDVPVLDPFINEADVMILPIFSGSGMKVKTCESLMYGKNIIATSEAFEGYDVDYDKVGGKCDTAEEFIRKLKDFEREPRRRFNEYSREMYLRKYSNDSIRGVYADILK